MSGPLPAFSVLRMRDEPKGAIQKYSGAMEEPPGQTADARLAEHLSWINSYKRIESPAIQPPHPALTPSVGGEGKAPKMHINERP